MSGKAPLHDNPRLGALVRVPIYKRIEEDLRDRVRRGSWGPNTSLPGRQALAREYGVDLRTVQRAIGILLADGTLRAHAGRGTFVGQPVDQPKRAEMSPIVAIISEQSFDAPPSWAITIERIQDALRARMPFTRSLKIDTYATTPDGVVAREHDALAVVEQQNLAGMVLFHCGAESTIPDIRRLLERGTPTVFIDALPDGIEGDFVGIDNQFAACDAIEYLISIGHKRIAILAPDDTASPVVSRLAGYQEALVSNGLEPNPDFVCRLPLALSLVDNSLRNEIARVVDRLMALDQPPTSIFAINDYLAQRLLEVLSERGISVPGSISVLGFDDVEQFQPAPGFLTTVRQRFDVMGIKAAELLIARLSEPATRPIVYHNISVATKLVVRQSTRPI